MYTQDQNNNAEMNMNEELIFMRKLFITLTWQQNSNLFIFFMNSLTLNTKANQGYTQ